MKDYLMSKLFLTGMLSMTASSIYTVIVFMPVYLAAIAVWFSALFVCWAISFPVSLVVGALVYVYRRIVG